MEHINKVELQGCVGAIRLNNISGRKMINFSLRTEHLHTTHLGENVMTATWHQVVAWQNVTKVDVESISKGDMVKVTGRLNNVSYRSATGESIVMTEVLANTLEMVESI